MKRIVVTVTNDLNFDQRMIRACSTLVESGYDVTLVGRELAHSKPLISRSFKQERIRCRWNKGPRFYAEFAFRLRRYLLEAKPDLVVACDLDTILSARTARVRKGIPFVFDAHEYFTEVPELQGRRIVQNVWSMIGKFCVPKASNCMTVAGKLSEALATKYGRKFEVIRNVPFRSTSAVLSLDQRDRVILYQGALNEGRGVDLAIDAMAHIHDFELHLAGEGDLSEELRARVKSKDLGSRVKFLGRVEPEELKERTSKAMIGLNLLENRGLNYYFSLANKFFDYMQVGTPSLNMDFPEYSGILAEIHSGMTLESLSMEKYLEAIQSMTDQQTWNDMHQASLRGRDTFNWENEKGKLVRIVEEAIAQ